LKPKLLFILHLAPPIHGASVVGSYIKNSNLINAIFETNYLNLSTASNLNDIGKTSWKKLWDIIKLYGHLVAYLIKNRVDLCYMTINSKGPAWLKELVIVAILKVFHISIIYHYHNKGVISNANSYWRKLLYKFQFKDSKSILLSSLLEYDIAQFVSKNDIYICPNGIPQNFYSSDLLINKKNKNDTCQILFFSNLNESKGLFILLEACKLLMIRKIPFRCILIGEEGDISVNHLIYKIRDLNLQNVAEYQGKKYGKDKDLAFCESDIFIFPTFYETFGLVNLEAMQHSLPIISTREGGIPDIVKDGVNGFLIPNRNSKVLADKLEILLSNPELRYAMGLAGKKMYDEKFTLEIFENRMVEILQDCINKKNA
jgi:glycosyltransferase involved in cell wall biosynthesis